MVNLFGKTMPKAGDELRDQIAQLLRLKYQNVTVEKRLEATTADVFFIDDTNQIFPRSIGVEAKDWKGPLTSQNIAEIHTLYAPSLNARTIDYLWIIGRHTLAGSPRQTISSLPNVRYSSFDEFRASLMNFTALLHNNKYVFEHDESSRNLIQARVRGTDQPLFEHVLEWLANAQLGLIVYGGYGLGKTTFSLYLASVLSQKYLAGEFERIPIRIALGGMYSKQDLIALICSALSGGESGVAVKDFAYGLFLEMNRQGQYLLIFDGFDEMRHAMDIDDFIYTFEQMKPLFSWKAKVVVLGRPDSFLSNQEEDQVLSALLDQVGDKSKKLNKVDVAFFTKNEVKQYLDKFIALRHEGLTDKQKQNYKSLMERLPDSEDNILSRPVQLKMFTKIIDECLSDGVILTRYELYKRFIYSFIGRESQKLARQPIRSAAPQIDLRDDRNKFMQAVAWWVLNAKKENRFLPEEIPTDLIPISLRSGTQSFASVREAIVGSVIEPISEAGVLGSKAKKYYFFPHKSYLEFLVANYFQVNNFSMDVYREFMRNLNHEILTFIEEGPAGGVANLREGLNHNMGSIDPRIVEVCSTDKRVETEVRSTRKHNHHPSQIYTHYFYLKRNPSDAESYLTARLGDTTTVESGGALLNCIADALAAGSLTALARSLVVSCLTTVSPHTVRTYAETRRPIEIYRLDIEALRFAVISRAVTCTARELSIDIDRLRQLAQQASRATLFVPLPPQTEWAKAIRLESAYVLSALTQDVHDAIEKIVKRRATKGAMIEARFMGPAAERLG